MMPRRLGSRLPLARSAGQGRSRCRPDLVSLMLGSGPRLGSGVSSDETGAPGTRLHSPLLDGAPDGDADRDLGSGPDEEPPDLSQMRFADLLRAQQCYPLPTQRASEFHLPLGELDPEVLERLAAEVIMRRPNRRAHFYSRRGQAQYGLDIVESEAADGNTACQVRRNEVLTADDITSAVTEYADPQAPRAAERKNLLAGSRCTGTCCSPRRSSRPRRVRPTDRVEAIPEPGTA